MTSGISPTARHHCGNWRRRRSVLHRLAVDSPNREIRPILFEKCRSGPWRRILLANQSMMITASHTSQEAGPCELFLRNERIEKGARVERKSSPCQTARNIFHLANTSPARFVGVSAVRKSTPDAMGNWQTGPAELLPSKYIVGCRFQHFWLWRG